MKTLLKGILFFIVFLLLVSCRTEHLEVMTVLPYLKEIKELGCQTFIDCTPSYMGRDPEVLKRLSDESGLHIIFGVGYYGAINNRFVPQHARMESAVQIAARWLEEWEHGCRETGITPGII